MAYIPIQAGIRLRLLSFLTSRFLKTVQILCMYNVHCKDNLLSNRWSHVGMCHLWSSCPCSSAGKCRDTCCPRWWRCRISTGGTGSPASTDSPENIRAVNEISRKFPSIGKRPLLELYRLHTVLSPTHLQQGDVVEGVWLVAGLVEQKRWPVRPLPAQMCYMATLRLLHGYDPSVSQ